MLFLLPRMFFSTSPIWLILTYSLRPRTQGEFTCASPRQGWSLSFQLLFSTLHPIVFFYVTGLHSLPAANWGFTEDNNNLAEAVLCVCLNKYHQQQLYRVPIVFQVLSDMNSERIHLNGITHSSANKIHDAVGSILSFSTEEKGIKRRVK